ncbi:hypothetical protein T02_12597, partial [Trichinella nativa]
LHVLPFLDEVCQVELYKTSFLSGWSNKDKLINMYIAADICQKMTVVGKDAVEFD